MMPQILMVKADSMSDFSTVSFTASDDDASVLDEGQSVVLEKTPEPLKVELVRRLPARSISCKGLIWTSPRDAAQTVAETSPKPRKQEQIRRPLSRTTSMPKRTIWKDKGGKSRYVLRDEPPPQEVKPVGYETVAKEALTDAVVSGGAAALAVLDAVTATKRRFDRQFSQKRLSAQEDPSPNDANAESPVGSRFAQGRRGLLRRAKSLGAVRAMSGGTPPTIPQRQNSPERAVVATTAA